MRDFLKRHVAATAAAFVALLLAGGFFTAWGQDAIQRLGMATGVDGGGIGTTDRAVLLQGTQNGATTRQNLQTDGDGDLRVTSDDADPIEVDVTTWSGVEIEDPYDVDGTGANERIPGVSIRTRNAAGASFEGLILRDTAGAAQLPAVAALANNAANPTTTSIAGMCHLWDGAGWDRSPGAQDDGARVELYGGGDGTTGVALLTSDLDTGAGIERSLGASLRIAAAGGSVAAGAVSADATSVGGVFPMLQDVTVPANNYVAKAITQSDDLANVAKNLATVSFLQAWDPTDGNWDRLRTTGGMDSGTLAAMAPAASRESDGGDGADPADAQINAGAAATVVAFTAAASGAANPCIVAIRNVFDTDCDEANAAQVGVVTVRAAPGGTAAFEPSTPFSTAAGACVDVVTAADCESWTLVRR